MHDRSRRRRWRLTLAVLVGVALKSSTTQAVPWTAGEEMTTIGRNEGYRRLFTILDSAEAALKQQPANLAAQANYLRDLETTLEAIRVAKPDQPKPDAEPAPSTTGPPGESTSAAPLGPVTPSTRPSSQENEQRRKAATAKPPGRGPLGQRHEQATLNGVPDSWIQPACARTSARSRELRERLTKHDLDRASILAALGQLRTSVQEIGSPPRPTR